MVMPCGRVKTPSPQEPRKPPSRSYTMTGCSLRLKTYTRSRESVATPATSPCHQPAGSCSQPSASSNLKLPSPTIISCPPSPGPQHSSTATVRERHRATRQPAAPLRSRYRRSPRLRPCATSIYDVCLIADLEQTLHSVRRRCTLVLPAVVTASERQSAPARGGRAARC